MANIIATVWDFDKTLIKGYMQDPLFEDYGVDGRKFWQVAKLLLTIQDIPSAQLYESATAPDISAQRLKRFNTTKVK